MTKAVPMPVPLKTDAVAPCRLTFGSLSVAGAEEGTPIPVDNALFFETADGLLGRVTFEGLDAIRASRGEVAPYDDCHDFSSWVYTVRKSGWLKERHAYEWKNYETPLLETHSHFLFRFHDEFVEAIAEGIWLDTASAADPFAVSEGHPLRPNFMGSVVDQGVTHGLAWKIRSVDRSPSSLVADSVLCSQPLYEYLLHLDGADSVCATALVRTRDGHTRTHLKRPWVGVVGSVDGVGTPEDFAAEWDLYCYGVAERRREMGK